MKSEPGGDIVRRAVALSGGMPGGAFGKDAAALPLTAGGSDRRFFRVGDGTRSAVLLVDGSDEFPLYVSIGGFLGECGVPAPAFYGVDERNGMILMEDLGSIHLEEALGALEVELTAEDGERLDAVAPPGRATVPYYGYDGLAWVTWGPHKFRW